MMHKQLITFEEALFLDWLRSLSNAEQESLDMAVITGEPEFVPLSVFYSYPQELFDIPTPERS